MDYEFVEMSQEDIDLDLFPPRSRKRTWWTERSLMEKVLAFTCLVSFCVSIGLAVSLLSQQDRSKAHVALLVEDSEVCSSKICVQEAARVLSRINNTTDP